MPVYQVTIEQLATVSTIAEVEVAEAAADLAIEVAPAWRGRRHATGYEVLEVEGVA